LEKKGFIHIADDVSDKRKQRISLTKMCGDFCSANAGTNREIISELFEGIPQESLSETIKVISMMEKNLKNIDERRLK
jgi:DNA-binding MarR family transcriptional regulator